jgi:hypothetical protein
MESNFKKDPPTPRLRGSSWVGAAGSGVQTKRSEVSPAASRIARGNWEGFAPGLAHTGVEKLGAEFIEFGFEQVDELIPGAGLHGMDFPTFPQGCTGGFLGTGKGFS